jgi:hypothetical protein
MTEINLTCFSCSKPSRYQDNVGYREECIHCRADMHVCKNCDFYDPKAYNECHESSADPVKEKERANFCDFYRPSTRGSGAKSQAESLKAAADALFKKK